MGRWDSLGGRSGVSRYLKGAQTCVLSCLPTTTRLTLLSSARAFHNTPCHPLSPICNSYCILKHSIPFSSSQFHLPHQNSASFVLVFPKVPPFPLYQRLYCLLLLPRFRPSSVLVSSVSPHTHRLTSQPISVDITCNIYRNISNCAHYRISARASILVVEIHRYWLELAAIVITLVWTVRSPQAPSTKRFPTTVPALDKLLNAVLVNNHKRVHPWCRTVFLKFWYSYSHEVTGQQISCYSNGKVSKNVLGKGV